MLKDITYKRPYIKVTWTDVPEAFTKERIRRIKKYFQEKYHARQVILKTNPVVNKDDIKLESLDVTDNILDKNYQKRLMEDFIKENEMDVDLKLLHRLDDTINNELVEDVDKIQYSKWLIKRIEFSNFLSFGDNNIIDFESIEGITAVESNPKNFGGKCVRSNTNVNVVYNTKDIIKKLGFLPDELK